MQYSILSHSIFLAHLLYKNEVNECFTFSGNIRNLAMEKVASTVLFPCKYSSSGCSMSLLHTQKTEHEELCEHRPYTCPCPGASCKWQGALEQVMPHLMMSHKSITTLQGNLSFITDKPASPNVILMLRGEAEIDLYRYLIPN